MRPPALGSAAPRALRVQDTANASAGLTTSGAMSEPQAGVIVKMSEGSLKRVLMMSGERCRPIRTVLRMPA